VRFGTRRLLGGMAGLALAMAAPGAPPARAQLAERLFAPGVPGFGAEPGVTVATRARPAHDPSGIRLGGVVVRPSLTTGLGLTSNVSGQPGGRASLVAQTSAGVLAGTAWGRHALGAFLGFDDQRFAADARQSATGYTAALGGTLAVGRDELTLGLAHQTTFQTSRALAGLSIDRPGRVSVETARAGYVWRQGRMSVAPALAVSDTRFDDVFVAGQRVVQRFRDRTAIEGGTTLRWELAPRRDLVLDLRAVGFDHHRRAPGQPSRDATTLAALAGIDYAADAVWRVRALAGVQRRDFADRALKPAQGPMAELSAIWQPSGMTTLAATASRRIEDAAELAAVSYSFTGLRLSVDHELRRDLLLSAYGQAQHAQYQQGGGQERLFGLGIGATWLVGRRVRVLGNWDWATRRRADGAVVEEGLALLRLRFAL
jgi:hypothetical protein